MSPDGGRSAVPSARRVVVVGLGPGAPGHLTIESHDLLREAARAGTLVLRTSVHPTVAAIDWLAGAPSYDHVYDRARDFDEVYDTIVADLVDRASRGTVTYAVPGHPAIGESTVARLRAIAREAMPPVRDGIDHAQAVAATSITVTVVPGVSFLDVVAPIVEIDLGDGVRVADALAPGPIDPTVPLLVCQVHSPHVAARLKLDLGRHYPDEHPVTIVRAAGVPGGERVSRVPLWQLDRRDDIDHLTTLWVPPLAPLEATREPSTLVSVMARLRAPDGCPWDREQTHASLRRFLLEETYEALEALDAGDVGALEEELGDLLLQIVFHAQVGSEEGTFDFGDVVSAITRKMIRRHPHVFADAAATTVGEVLEAWEATKRAERAEQGDDDGRLTSMLDGVPRSLPALAQSQAVQDRAARVGFDWPDVNGVLEKLVEEAGELAAARPEDRADELGDVLFVVTNLARHLGVDAEEALRLATAKFRRRFGHVEALVIVRGLAWASLDLPALDRLWVEAKAATDVRPG